MESYLLEYLFKAKDINELIQHNKPTVDTNDISDGYHTFGELYEHRIQLYIALCKHYNNIVFVDDGYVWRSKLHSDGSAYEGWFILGIGTAPGRQISYHLPISKWDECAFATERERAPEWDGHTAADVLERLKNL